MLIIFVTSKLLYNASKQWTFPNKKRTFSFLRTIFIPFAALEKLFLEPFPTFTIFSFIPWVSRLTGFREKSLEVELCHSILFLVRKKHQTTEGDKFVTHFTWASERFEVENAMGIWCI